MYLRRIKLINFIGIYIGQGCETLEIEMNNLYPITLIRSVNGFGKTTLLSAMSSPYAYDGGMDNRNNSDIIRTGYLGEKEMEYVDGKDVYLIHHYYKPNQNNGHSVKSYLFKNGVSMNPNGNVSSFEQLIQSIFGIVDKDLMLLRLGTNTTTFASLSSMDRKKYLSRIIGDIDIYMQLYGMLQSDIRVNKALISNYSEEMSKLSIDDIAAVKMSNDKKKSKTDKLLMELGRLKADLQSISSDTTDVAQLAEEKNQLMSKLSFASTIDSSMKKLTLEDMRNSRRLLEDQRSGLQNRINNIKSTMDSNSRSIEFAQIDLQKLVIDDSISSKVASLETEISDLSKKYKNFKPKLTSREFTNIYQDINTMRTLLQIVIGYESNIVTTILDLYQKDADIGEWVDKSMSSIVDPESKLTMTQHMKRLLSSGYEIPDCSDVKCIYKKLGEMISIPEVDDQMTVDFVNSVRSGIKSFDNLMTLRSTIPNILPKQLMDVISEDNIIKTTREGKIFSIDLFDNFRSLLYGYESYQQKIQQLASYKEQESSKQRMIIMRGDAEARIRKLSDDNNTLITKLSSLKSELSAIDDKATDMDVKIGKKIEYEAIKDMISSYKKRIDEIDTAIESATAKRSKMQSIRSNVDLYNSQISELQQETSDTDTRISLYEKYQSEIVRLNSLIVNQNKILRNVSVKEKGIPLLYMKLFFDKIRIKCNELLDVTYDGNLKIGEFDPSSPIFDIPYIKNGIVIRDVKLSSQGEQPVINIALSFAMSSLLVNKKYNILCCDELDSTLDYQKKLKYPEMLNMHIGSMGIEQCFVISHSEVFDTIPTNVIDLNDDPTYIRGSNMYTIKRS